MSDTQDFQSYGFDNLRWVRGSDGLTYVKASTEQNVMIVAWLEVPGGYLDKASIDQFVTAFRAGPGKGANKAICSICHDQDHHQVLDPKPISLKRHLYHHFGIKGYGCQGCGKQFVTRDQVVVHSMTHHMQTKDRKSAAGYVIDLYAGTL